MKTCRLKGCERLARARGLCMPDYLRWMRKKRPAVLAPRVRHEGCTECERQHYARGKCFRHYMQWLRKREAV